MQEIILIGYGPDPLKSDSRSAFSLRTAMFKKALLENGFKVSEYLVSDSNVKGCFNINSSKDRKRLAKTLKNSAIRTICCTGYNACDFVAKLKLDKFLAFDLNGWTLAEIEARSFFDKSNALNKRFVSMEKRILSAGDFFTTVSNAQKYAVYGELALSGKLGIGTFGKPVVSSIANKGLQFNKVIPYTQIDPNDFNLLWLGGFNNWADYETLFYGVCELSKKHSFIKLIVTGGAIKNVNEDKYKKFVELVDNSKYKNNFKLLNWADAKQIPGIIKASQIGINCDLDCLETRTGARNRINEMIANGLPVISSSGSEVSEYVASKNFGTTFESGNYKDLAEKIELAMGSQHKIWKQNLKKYSPDYSDFAELVTFLQTPYKIKKSFTSKIESLVWYMRKKSFSDLLKKLGL